MSATADIARYRDYFKDLGRGERVEVLAIPSTNRKTILERRVIYLEQAFTYMHYLILFFFGQQDLFSCCSWSSVVLFF